MPQRTIVFQGPREGSVLGEMRAGVASELSGMTSMRLLSVRLRSASKIITSCGSDSAGLSSALVNSSMWVRRISLLIVPDLTPASN